MYHLSIFLLVSYIVSGWMIKNMEEESRYGQTDPSMKAIGERIKQLSKESLYRLMEIYMKESG